jgi:peptidoglycan hydrolase-like protein with peptidoglycan-binding domain
MRTRRFVASLLTGLALVMGTATVSQAAPAGEEALPKCTSFSTIVRDYVYLKLKVTLPTTGYMNKDTNCELRRGDRYDGVFVLQGAIKHCFTDIEADRIYGPITESVVRLIQGQNGLPTTGVYRPETKNVMKWQWFTMNNQPFGCMTL